MLSKIYEYTGYKRKYRHVFFLQTVFDGVLERRALEFNKKVIGRTKC